jgi:soluble lytic murein transglycosylase-like protein
MLLLTVVPGPHASSAPRTAPRVAAGSIEDHIKEAATRYAVREDLVAAVIEAESQFNPRAVSRRGAKGLMQLMPGTAAVLGVRDPFDPRENIDGGVKHLRFLLDRFDHDLPVALAAYNAGERAVMANRGIPPYPETRRYVKRIMQRIDPGWREARGPAPRSRKI